MQNNTQGQNTTQGQNPRAQSPSAPTSSTPARRDLRWRVVDIVVASVVAVASGIVFWAWGLATNVLGLAFEFLPGLGGLLGGGWLFAGVLGGLIIRKPGAAVYTELVAAAVSALIGTQWGFLVLLSGLVQGLGAEIVLALFLYRSGRPLVAILAGGGAGLALAINDLLFYYPANDDLFRTVYVLSSIVSGAVLAGLLPWLAVRGLAASGALDRFASGREGRVIEGAGPGVR
ncbi:energy-coupling factor transport system substrate-specific component [Rathayibacter tanaceti]|uniref:Energy-coupling factor transport system substrate-specific component n=1 Tax=Rathayibacter tanaceti TaxID=1671680 RepID=A0ACD2XNV5_9MICO|nr:energy-coupling factor transport system substrate-specific component [Rathayibacter tanaceti]